MNAPTGVTYGRGDGPAIKGQGKAYRKASVTWVWDPGCTEEFTVQTAEGAWLAKPGDLLCYDEKSGNVWSISPSYVEQNYEQVGFEDVDTTRMQEGEGSPQELTQLLFRALEALSGAARHLSAVDVSNAEVNLAEPRYRPLTQLCGEAAAEVQEFLEAHVGIATEQNVGTGHDAPVLSLAAERSPDDEEMI